jgi:hypothetical protein
VIKQDDPANVSGYPRSTLQIQKMTGEHGCKNTEDGCPGAGWQKSADDGAKGAAHERSGQPRESELRRLGGHQVCNDDRGNHGVKRMLESQELGSDERETRGHGGTQ